MNTVDQGYEIAKRVRAAKHWLVRSAGNVVGPVSIELIERGLEAGKIPPDAEMTFEGGKDWRRVSEVFGAAEAPAAQPTASQPSVPQPSVPQPPAPQPKPTPIPAIMPLPAPPAPIFVHYADEPVHIPKQGVVASLFG